MSKYFVSVTCDDESNCCTDRLGPFNSLEEAEEEAKFQRLSAWLYVDVYEA